jgi:hypothetical protein
MLGHTCPERLNNLTAVKVRVSAKLREIFQKMEYLFCGFSLSGGITLGAHTVSLDLG